MGIEDLIEEKWFIGVVVGGGALILILVVIIITLCCLWSRRKNKEDSKTKQHGMENESSEASSYQEITEGQNWTLVSQQNGIHSAPALNDMPRHIKGDDPYIAGSSMVKMNSEMKSNGVQSSRTYTETQPTNYRTGVEQTLQQNQNVDAFDRKWSNASDANRGGRRGGPASSSYFERAGVDRESYQKPRIANIQVSQSNQYDSNARASYLKDRDHPPQRSNSTRSTQTTVYNQSNQLYRIPQEDYSGIEMYSDEERDLWRAPAQNPSLNRLSDAGKVKNLTEKFNAPEASTGIATNASSRSALENEIKYQIAERRLQQRAEAVPMSPLRKSQEYQPDSTVYPSQGSNPSSNWQGRSGKATIDNRVNRIRKVGAVSVFPD